jgi:hypothetical protein
MRTVEPERVAMMLRGDSTSAWAVWALTGAALATKVTPLAHNAPSAIRQPLTIRTRLMKPLSDTKMVHVDFQSSLSAGRLSISERAAELGPRPIVDSPTTWGTDSNNDRALWDVTLIMSVAQRSAAWAGLELPLVRHAVALRASVA